jgi:hypothetical protein
MKKQILTSVVVSTLCICLHTTVIAADDKQKEKDKKDKVDKKNSNTPGSSNNPGGQSSGSGNYNNPTQGNSNSGGPKEIPIDGGLSLLLAAGVGLGAKRLFFNKKEETA